MGLKNLTLPPLPPLGVMGVGLHGVKGILNPEGVNSFAQKFYKS